MNTFKNTYAYSDLVSEIYATPLEKDGWQQLMERLHAECEGAKVFLIGYDLQARTDLGCLAAGFDPEMLRLFGEYYSHINPYAPGWRRAPAGVVLNGDELCPRDEVLASEFYADFVRPQKCAVGGCGVPLFSDDTRFIAFGAHVIARDIDRNLTPLMRAMRLMTPHLIQAFEISRALGGRTLEHHARARLGSRQGPVATEVLAVNAAGRILYLSCAAEERLEQGRDLRVGSWHRLAFTDPRADAAFRAALRRLERGTLAAPMTLEIGGGAGSPRA